MNTNDKMWNRLRESELNRDQEEREAAEEEKREQEASCEAMKVRLQTVLQDLFEIHNYLRWGWMINADMPEDVCDALAVLCRHIEKTFRDVVQALHDEVGVDETFEDAWKRCDDVYQQELKDRRAAARKG